MSRPPKEAPATGAGADRLRLRSSLWHSVTYLKTRFLQPELFSDYVPRPRALALLDAGLAQGRRLTIITAPAGYGKSTLAAAWLRTVDRPAAWLSLAAEDDDPHLLLGYIIAALQTAVPLAGERAASLLELATSPSAAEVTTLLLNDLAELETPLLLVLDDVHVLASGEARAIIRFLAERLPPNIHLALLSRHEPPFPLHQVRARGQLTELRSGECRFTAAESAAFLERALAEPIPVELAGRMSDAADGWIAGLRLMALHLERETGERERSLVERLEAFDGRHNALFDFFTAEVIEQLPADRQAFLRDTSILDRFTAALCDAVAGREDSAEILRDLEAQGLFLIPLDSRRTWYRYHHLLADYLRQSLTDEMRRALHERASGWHEATGDYNEALWHAFKADSLAAAARIFPLHLQSQEARGFTHAFRQLLNGIPDTMADSNALLATMKAWGRYVTGNMKDVMAYAARAEALLTVHSPELDILASHALFADLARARQEWPRVSALGSLALGPLAGESITFTSYLLQALADGLRHQGKIPEARAALESAIALCLDNGERLMLVNALILGMEIWLSTGDLRLAERQLSAIADELLDSRGRPLPTAVHLTLAKGVLAYARGDLPEAVDKLTQSVERVPALSSFLNVGVARVTLARAYFAAGNQRQALDEIAALVADEERYGAGQKRGLAAAVQAELQLRAGMVAAAAAWAEAIGIISGEPADFCDEAHHSYARLLLAQDRPAEARRHLRPVLATAGAEGRYGDLLAGLVLEAQAAARQKRRTAARRAMRRAIEIAAPEAWVRPFLDAGEGVAAILPAVRDAAPRFVDTLVTAFDVNTGRAPEGGGPPLRLHLFGALELHLNGRRVVDLYSARTRALLAYLATAAGEPHDRAQLATLLWEGYGDVRARRNLRNTLSRLRQILTPARGIAIEASRQSVQLVIPPEGAWIDVRLFDGLLAQCRRHNHLSAAACPECRERLVRATAVYRGDFLSSLDIPDAPAFDAWRRQRQEARHRQVMVALDTLCNGFAADNELEQVMEYAERQLALEPWHEPAHHHLVRALALSGRRTLALNQLQLYRQVIREELAVEPSPSMQQLYVYVRDAEPGKLLRLLTAVPRSSQ